MSTAKLADQDGDQRDALAEHGAAGHQSRLSGIRGEGDDRRPTQARA